MILAGADQLDSVEDGRALGGRVARVVQPHHGETRDALPGAGLSDDPERLTPLDGERDAVDRLDDAVIRSELGAKVLDLEQRHLS